MKLPDDSIGITDLIARRECKRRFSYGMRRHTGKGEQSDELRPEESFASTAETAQRIRYRSAYGSAIHAAIQATEEGNEDKAAIQLAWNEYGRYLEPGDVELLAQDLLIYHRRDFPGTRSIAVEDDLRVPLFVHEGVQIYFRFKLDRLYERIDAPGVYIAIDYKSSKWTKTQKEVHEDLQLWAYNFGAHEFFPEIDELHQFYDQLTGGQLPTRKSSAQRKEIRAWLIAETTATLEDENYEADGLLEPSFNQWCPYCPIMESCRVVPELSEFARTRLAALAPRTPKLKKDGTPGKQMVDVPLELARVDEYTAEMEKSKIARQVAERFEESVKELVRALPADRRENLGYKLRDRKNSRFTPQAARALHEALGDRFYELVSITKTALESNIAEDEDLLAWALDLAESVAGTQSVVRVVDA